MASVRTQEQIYQEISLWKNHLDREAKNQLDLMEASELAEAFYKDLSFGTGGLRGKLGLGPNRLNEYTVGRATQGLADYLNASFNSPSVVLCRDTRNGSEEFVRRVAEVFAGNGICSLIFERVEPTPLLSFAVRELGCTAGVNITASHNPAIYNGYKVYGSDGCQVTVAAASLIQHAIDQVECFSDVRLMTFDAALQQGLVRWVPERTLDRYIEETLKASTGEDCSSLSVVYTPLHGVGLECVERVLKGIGLPMVAKVKEQCVPNGDFPTCPYPNPEVPDALRLGLRRSRQLGADLLLATDPDADRVGISVAHGSGFKLLSGDEVGLLLLDFLSEMAEASGINLASKVALTTIVSAPMADDISLDRGFELRRTLTGFKYIGEQIGLLEACGHKDSFLLGFEESYGYLTGTCVRDKDAIVSSMLICELAAHWKAKGLDLYEAMSGLYKRYGFWSSAQLSRTYEGPQGSVRMAEMMRRVREAPPISLGGIAVSKVIDYLLGAEMPCVNSLTVQRLPAADVIELRLCDGSRVLLRPSGTEPKAKAYVFAKGSDVNAAESELSVLRDNVMKLLEGNISA